MDKKFYITTAIPYVNGRPHIGHALEYFQADTIRRYHQLLGENTLMLSGADENALKNVQMAEKHGIPTQEFLDIYSQIWKDGYEKLHVKLDVFQRGSDQKKHWPGVQKLWELCEKNEDIYKKSYKGLYCVGCESFKTHEELVDGLCPDHHTKPEEVSEENYFFRLSKYQDVLLQKIESNELRVVPTNKRQETISFIKQGLVDFSISRSKERARGVGVPIPHDPNQVMYVWFDALTIYMTGIGYGWNQVMWAKWWPADVHVIGKDINRFHTVYWPAMLLSAGLPLPKTIFIHGFVYASDGTKMSKSVGNVIDPFEFTQKYGLEPTRYCMLSQFPSDADSNFSVERFKEVYTADLANGLGNLIARVAKLAEKINLHGQTTPETIIPEIKEKMNQFLFNEALQILWSKISDVDRQINQDTPWKLEGDELKGKLNGYISQILLIAYNLQPFLPETAEKILTQFTTEKVVSDPALFPRLM